jgi:hypothetical protein
MCWRHFILRKFGLIGRDRKLFFKLHASITALNSFSMEISQQVDKKTYTTF